MAKKWSGGMGIQATSALLPAATRRNRMVLTGFVIAAAPFVALGTGLFDRNPLPGPLLVAVDEMPVETSQRAALSSMREAAKPTVDQVSNDALPPAPPGHLMARDSLVQFGLAKSILSTIEPGIDQPEASLSIDEQPLYDFDDSMRWFNGRPVREVRKITMTVTAYSPDERSCGQWADGVTASGYSVWTNGMKLAAADTSVLPFGSLISVPGYDGGAVVPVLDRGGAIKGNRLDMLYPTHEQARRWGAQQLEVTIWEYADGQPHDFKARFNSASAVKN